jgi:hypothetical protein
VAEVGHQVLKVGVPMRPRRPGPKASDHLVVAPVKRGGKVLRIDLLGPTRLMLNVVKSTVRWSAGGMLAAALLWLLLPAGLAAQTVGSEPASRTALTVCDDDRPREYKYELCDEYIDGNIRQHADAIKWILGRITSWKDYSQGVSNFYYSREEIVQWIIVVLSLFMTIAAALAKLYPKLVIRQMDFAITPIALSALIAAVTSINAYYKFDEYRRLSQSMADDLAELESDIHFLVLRHVASQQQQHVNEDTVAEWHERLKTIMQRYSQRETGNGV